MIRKFSPTMQKLSLYREFRAEPVAIFRRSEECTLKIA